MSDISLLFNLIGKDNVSKVFGSAESKMAKLAKGVAIGGAAIVAAAGTAGAALFAIGDQFDGAYDKIRVTTGATGKALEGLKNDFRAVVKDVPADFETASSAIADLNQRTGATGPTLQNLSKQMLELSRITGTDVSTNTASITRVFGDWAISTENQSGAMDALFRASQATGMGVDSLAQKVVQFGAPLRQFGFSFEESIALLGKWEKEGVNTEVVLAGMKAGLGNFSKAGKEPIQALADITQAIKDAGDAGTANKIAIEAFGKRAGPDMAAAVREGRLELGDLLDVVKNGSDTIMKAGKDTMDFSEKWQMFKNGIMLKLEPLAMRVFDALGAMGSKLEPAFAAAQEFVTGKLIPAIRSLASWFMDKLWPAISETGLFVKNVAVVAFELLRPVMLLVAGAALAIGKVLIEKVIPAFKNVMKWLNDNKGVIKAVAVVIAALLIPHWVALGVAAMVSAGKQVAAWAMSKASTIAAAVMHSAQVVIMVAKYIALGAVAMAQALVMAAAWVIAMGPIGWVIAAIVALVVLIVANWDAIWTKTVEIWNAIWKFVSDLITTIKNWIVNRFNDVIAFFKNIPGWIRSALSTVWDVISFPFRKAVDWIKERFNGLMDFFRGIPAFFKRIGKGISDGITAGFKGAVNFLIGLINGLIGGINKLIHGINIVNPFDDIPPIPKIPKLAKGGTLSHGGLAMVGEQGREIVSLPAGATVHPNRETEAAMKPPSPSKQVAVRSAPTVVRLELASDGTRVGDLLLELFRKTLRDKGIQPPF